MVNRIPEDVRKYMHNRKYWVHCSLRRGLIIVFRRERPHEVVMTARLKNERRNENDKRTKN